MLALARRVGQQIRITDEIIVRVLEVGPGRVKLGIQAPPHIAVHREEIWARIQAERDGQAGAQENL